MKTAHPALVVSMLALAGCAQEPPADAGGDPALTLHFAALGTCGSNGNADRQFPTNADRVVLRLSGGSLAAPVTMALAKDAANAQGELLFQKIPVGSGMALRVAACDGAATTWAGVTNDVAVAEFEKSFPEVFLTPVDGVACVGNAASTDAARKTSEARVFGATATLGEDTWVLGGAKKVSGAPPVLEGGATVDAYDRLSGEFHAAGTLAGPRILALARPLADGRVRLVGGAAKVRLAAPGKPPISADAADAPASASELFDPASGTSSAEAVTPLPVLPALAAMADGTVVAAGGGSAPTFSKTLALVRGAEVVQADMEAARFGAVVVALDPTHALVWGGNGDALLGHLGVLVDTAVAPDAGQTALTVTGATSIPAFASAVRLGTDADGKVLVVVAGGTSIPTAGVYGRDVAMGRLELVAVDLAGMAATVTAVEPGTLGQAAFARAAANLVVSPDGALIFFGGYTAFQASALCAGSTVDCVQSSIARFTVATGAAPVAAGLSPTLEMTVGPLGAMSALLADGSCLIVAGLAGSADTAPSRAAGLLRYGGFDPDLCATVP